MLLTDYLDYGIQQVLRQRQPLDLSAKCVRARASMHAFACVFLPVTLCISIRGKKDSSTSIPLTVGNLLLNAMFFNSKTGHEHRLSRDPMGQE